jgi:OmpA-OmpF porin, OOP family
MSRTYLTLTSITVAAVMSGCATPGPVAELDAARVVVPNVEASPRSGVAATNVAEARKALDQANKLSEKGGDTQEIAHEATVALRNAEIANEKILTAQANEEIQRGTAERQQVLIEARNREAELQRARATSMEQELRALQAKQTDRGMILTLGDVLFDTGKATLKPAAFETLDRLAQVLREDASRNVLIEGHTDSTGSDDMNMALSLQRARSVQGALMQRGVAASQIDIGGRGESTPLASNDTATGRQQNRRVEMVFTQEMKQVAGGVD